jgi:hypothetical protein
MLVVPVGMDHECLAVPIVTVKQFLPDVWLAGRGHPSRHPVFGRKDPVDLSVGLTVPGQRTTAGTR